MNQDQLGGKVGTGIAGLDDILRGGLPADRMYLVTGDPGSGKTTLAIQFLLEGARLGESVLYVTLSETAEELTGVADSHGWSLDGINLYDLSIPEKKVDVDEQQYTLFHPSEVELGEVTRSVLAEVERVQPKRVVFDSLSEMRLLSRESLRYRRQILALKQFFAGRGCTILLLDDNTTSASSDRELASLVHGVFALSNTSPDYGAPRRVLRVVKLRGVNYRGGYHDLAIQTGGMIVFPRLVAAEHQTAFEARTMSSGVEQLDALTMGGLEVGTSTLISGPAGAGKSTLAMQYAAAAAARGERSVFFTFDEVLHSVYSRAAALGIDIEGLVESGMITIRQIDPAELSPGEFSWAVRDEVENNNAALVVIDSLNGYHQSMPDQNSLILHMHELLGYLNLQGVATILVMSQSGLLGANMRSPVDISYLADSVLLLRYFEFRGEVRKAISVVKMRGRDHERAVRQFHIGPNGVNVGEKLSNLRGILTGVPEFLGGTDLALKETNNGED